MLVVKTKHWLTDILHQKLEGGLSRAYMCHHQSSLNTEDRETRQMLIKAQVTKNHFLKMIKQKKIKINFAGNRKFTVAQKQQFFKLWTCINPTISRFVNQDINLHFIFIGSAERKGCCGDLWRRRNRKNAATGEVLLVPQIITPCEYHLFLAKDH